MKSVTVHYPGRVCLLGEHCDWAGGASLAAPLPLGIRVTAEPAPGSNGVSLLTSLDGTAAQGRWPTHGSVDPGAGPLRFVPAALTLLLREGLRVPPARLHVESDLPTGRGFSSSAAFSLAILDALAMLAGHKIDPTRLVAMAFEVEHDLLGVECGLLDPLVCATARPLLIRWLVTGDGGYAIENLSPSTAFHLLVGAFPAPRDTRGILAALNRDRRDGGAATAAAFATFERMAIEGATALTAGRPVDLGVAMNRAQQAYEDDLEAHLPELAAPLLRRACSLLSGLGALGAKFTGAGGDGSVIALFSAANEARGAQAVLMAEFGMRTFYMPLG